jgi:ankyrin repeat protein
LPERLLGRVHDQDFLDGAERGHDVNVRDDIGETPLHGAAAWGHCTAVRTLLKLGARPDLVSIDGMTALHWAAGWGGLGVVRALVRAGADTKTPDAHGRTPAQLAASRGKAKVAAWLAAHDA